MDKRIFLIFSLFVLMLFGCGTNQDTKTSDQQVEFTKLSTGLIDQSPSNQAKELISEHEAVTNVKAINSSDQLLIAVEIDHMKRFRLKEIEKELHKKMKKTFDDYKVELSMDKKIVLELEELENKIKNNAIKKEKLNKEIDRIIKLSHEKT